MKRVASPALWQPPLRGLALVAQKVPQAALFVLMVFSSASLGLGVLLLPVVVAAVRRLV
ncbi:hypothetical protein [Streptomyces sp. NPDC002785]|uniref:hypothetical protein n=1 Tax=Streptomyces sp. NPDC002785 TaxID=3154543 RepID=UPI00331F4BA1